MLSGSFVRRRRRAAGRGAKAGQDGFTIIEVLVASMILMIALLSMAYVGTSSLAQVNLSRQRQTANNLATQTMEQVRALPFSTVSLGLASSDVGSDSNITTNTCSPGLVCYGTETIPTTSSPPASGTTPLYPHVSSTTVNGTPYTISTYVSEYNNTTSPNVLRVTVLVSWTKAAVGVVASSVKVQTLVYSSSSGCLVTTDHPFSGPCQPSFFASAADGASQVGITPDSTSPNSTPVSLTSASLDAMLANDTMTINQVSSVTGSAQNSGLGLRYGSTVLSQGTPEVTATADSDPSVSGVTYSTASTSGQTAGTLSVSDAGGSTLAVTGSGGDTGSAETTTSAGGTNTCTDLSGTAITNSEPCGFETATQASATSATLDVKEAPSQGSSDLGTATLVSLPSETTKAFTTYVNSSGGSYCASTSGDGCVHSGATRSFATGQAVTLGGLPSGATQPTGWNGYLVKITNWTDSVSTEVGVGAATPTASNSASISYWVGSGYQTATVGSSSSSIPVSGVSTSGSLGGQTYTVTETVSAASTGSASTSTQSATTATSASPQFTIDYKVVWGAESWGLDISFNLGSLTASGTYGAAPSGS